MVWYWQIVGREIRMIDCERNCEGTLAQRVAPMLAKGYSYGKHSLPHDAEQTERTGNPMAAELRKAGQPNIVSVSRTASISIGFNYALELFPPLVFRSPQCADGLAALSVYRKRRQGAGALTSDEPVHDWASHPAHPFRMMAEAHRAGLVQFPHTMAEVKRDWYFAAIKQSCRGMKQARVSAGW